MIEIRYHSTSCYFLKNATGDRLLAVDAGWPCTLGEYMRRLKQAGWRFDRISWACVTHFHMDHAGLVADFVRRGIQCLVFRNQLASIEGMEKLILRACPDYQPIDRDRLVVLDVAESGRFFQGIGIDAEAVLTDAHSEDSISIVTAAGEACIGDLYPIDQIMPDDAASRRGWELLKSRNVRIAYPSHAGPIILS